MNARIRELRKLLQLNQTDFGKKIGVKQTTIAGYETGVKNPLESVILAICKEFSVNEEWLRNGCGSMFKTIDDKLSAYVSEITDSDDDFIKDLIEVYWELDDVSKLALKKLARGMAEKQIKREQK